MEPVPPVAQSIASFVHQARKSATPELSENIHKLSDSQIGLALKVIKNTNNMWGSYQEGTNAKMEKELGNIVMILAGATDGNQKPVFSLQSFLQTREKRTELREKQIENLVNSINQSSLQLNQNYVFEEKSTNTLVKELRGSYLTNDVKLTAQLYRDYSAILGHIKIGGKAVGMTLPEKSPDNWDQLIPQEIKTFIGPAYSSIAPSLALLLTQGIASDPILKGMELIHDPMIPDAKFRGGNYPDFEFSIKNNEVILLVKSTGFLGVVSEDQSRTLRIRDYEMTQTINLSNPEALVKMVIASKND